MYMPNLLIFFIGLQYVYSANILFIAPALSPSHHIWNRQLTFALIENGHNITMISHDVEKTKTENFSIIHLEGVYEKLYAQGSGDALELFSKYPILWVKDMFYITEIICVLDFETEGLKTMIKYPKDSFDIILYDATSGQCLYPLIDIFNVPVIAVTPYLLPNYLSNSMGNHWYPSYMPLIGVPTTNRMCFTERVTSFFFKHLEIFVRNYYYMGRLEELTSNYFGRQVRPFLEYEAEFTLLLSNTDPILDYPISLPPNIISVGGLHAHPAKPLSKEYEEIMTNAKHGVILFSLGTNIKSNLLPLKVRENIIAALGKLKQTVLWKFNDKIEGLPKNVIVKEWLPQNDILGHPNTKVFISHGGALGTQEAMYHGVPVLGIPFLLDQMNNVGKLVARKQARTVPSYDITTDNLYEQIMELLTNPIYSNNMKRISKKFKDQPQTPKQRAVFWIEHVIKHGPLDEFALPTKDMNVFQIYSLDVMALFAGIIAVFLLVIRAFLKRIFCKKCIKKEKLN